MPLKGEEGFINENNDAHYMFQVSKKWVSSMFNVKLLLLFYVCRAKYILMSSADSTRNFLPLPRTNASADKTENKSDFSFHLVTGSKPKPWTKTYYETKERKKYQETMKRTLEYLEDIIQFPFYDLIVFGFCFSCLKYKKWREEKKNRINWTNIMKRKNSFQIFIFT